jgi:ABC-type microcin C transport system duplicated ATPase subunit YejF
MILEVKNLTVRFPVTGGVLSRKVGEVRAVESVSLELGKGEERARWAARLSTSSAQ